MDKESKVLLTVFGVVILAFIVMVLLGTGTVGGHTEINNITVVHISEEEAGKLIVFDQTGDSYLCNIREVPDCANIHRGEEYPCIVSHRLIGANRIMVIGSNRIVSLTTTSETL
jgi:hypothetical protein